jgi:predicted small secreted protein
MKKRLRIAISSAALALAVHLAGCASLQGTGQNLALAATDSLFSAGRDELMNWAAPRGPETQAYLGTVADQASTWLQARLVAVLAEWLR